MLQKTIENKNVMKEHQKHASLSKSITGSFGRTEISILGTPCGNIKKLAFNIIKYISNKYKISYVDADHKNADHEAIDYKTAISFGASMEYTDKINFQRFDYKTSINEYQIKSYFLEDDLVLINGNHFEAEKQMVVIDPAKPLQKKLNKMTHVIAFILKDSFEVPEYLKEHIADYESIPIFFWDEDEKIINHVKEYLHMLVPELKGLILAGGKSSRMKQDKSLLNYHGKSQIEHIHELLKPFCKETFISCPADQKEKIPAEYAVIEDSFLDLGPFGAILSAFKKYPHAAWLVLACDLPLLDSETLNYLIQNRQPSRIATAFSDADNKFPEPLITIWEPKSYFKLLYFLGLGYSCPRKVLINSDCNIIKAPDVKVLQNINYPDEFEAVKSSLEKKIN